MWIFFARRDRLCTDIFAPNEVSYGHIGDVIRTFRWYVRSARHAHGNSHQDGFGCRLVPRRCLGSLLRIFAWRASPLAAYTARTAAHRDARLCRTCRQRHGPPGNVGRQVLVPRRRAAATAVGALQRRHFVGAGYGPGATGPRIVAPPFGGARWRRCLDRRRGLQVWRCWIRRLPPCAWRIPGQIVGCSTQPRLKPDAVDGRSP